MVQKSLKKPFSFEGIGIHSGQSVQVTCLPAAADTGIIFRRLDLAGKEVPVCPDSLKLADRCTQLHWNSVDIFTPEHLLAACAGLGIDNMAIEIDHAEVPIMDGSALSFATGFLDAGIQELSAPVTPFVITQPILVQEGDRYVIALPSPISYFSYVLSYPDTFIGSQTITASTAQFLSDIAPARTYGFEAEIQALLDRGLAQGGCLDNAVVIGKTGYLSELRFPDELVRHKTLDLMGDLWVLGRPILGHVIGVKSGHALNAQFVKELEKTG